ncbi:MAG: hypothetical protein MZV64_28480 [Ignavibacteriales bacterium]|nr:hypothetical protein [Ignavibacteriales bacterium]
MLFDSGDEITVQAGDAGVRFLLVSGRAARGTRRVVRPHRHEHGRRLRQAYAELRAGTFIR